MTVSTRSRPKAAGQLDRLDLLRLPVSTRSRPKAAGEHLGMRQNGQACFNTQPPEGGWLGGLACKHVIRVMFQHAAARRRLDTKRRTKCQTQSFNTQPPEGGWTGKGGLAG